MIKRTLYFGNPAYLRLKDEQLVVCLPEAVMLPEKDRSTTIPIEDIGVIITDHPQVTLTHSLIDALLKNNSALITCDNRHMPTGLLLPLEGNSIQEERFEYQLRASEPLRKRLWQHTVRQKIINQANLLFLNGRKIENMLFWAEQVKSGDTQNHEGRAAAYYWSEMFETLPQFRRHREGASPNNLLNYGYAILRAVMARSLVASGLLPTLGIHHHNRYNAFCLADDLMEPYRPYVDRIVLEMISTAEITDEISKDQKKKLLQIPVVDVLISDRRSPLMLATQQTSASVVKCFQGLSRKIEYPELRR